MASRKNAPVVRIDAEFEKDMKNIARMRLDKGLARLNMRDISIPEMTRLLRRTNGYRISLEELKFKPKKENIK